MVEWLCGGLNDFHGSAFGLPVPGQQPVDFGCFGPAGDDALEDVGEIGERFDVV